MSKHFKVKSKKGKYLVELPSTTKVWSDDEQAATIFNKSQATKAARSHKGLIEEINIAEIDVEFENVDDNE